MEIPGILHPKHKFVVRFLVPSLGLVLAGGTAGSSILIQVGGFLFAKLELTCCFEERMVVGVEKLAKFFFGR